MPDKDGLDDMTMDEIDNWLTLEESVDFLHVPKVATVEIEGDTL